MNYDKYYFLRISQKHGYGNLQLIRTISFRDKKNFNFWTV